jgi:PAS domain S-box-containing protein
MTDRQRAERDVLAELATLGSLALAAGRARTSHEIAAAALDILARSSGADAGVVLFNDGSGFDVEGSFGFPPGAVEALVAGRTLSASLASALDAGSSPVFAALSAAPIAPEIADRLAAHGIAHVLVTPLRAAGHLVGLLGLGWRTAPAAPPPDTTILHAATVVVASLENARLIEQLQRTLASERRLADEEVALQSLTLIAETAGAFDELAATTIRQIVALLGAVGGSYALLTADDRLVHSASVGVDRAFIDAALNLHVSDMRSVQRLLEGSGPYIQDYIDGSVRPETIEMARARAWTTFAVIPITVRDRLEALIVLFFDAAPQLPSVDRTLAMISRIASISLANFRLRERLMASESRYRVLFEESPDAIVLLSSRSEIVDANPAALRLFRTDLDGLRAFLASGRGRISEAEFKARAEILGRNGRGVFQDTGRRPDGTTFPQEIGIVRVQIGGEERYLLIVRDLTEQFHVQQELLQAQKMEAIGQLVSGVAHELNNPLAAIVAFSQLIRRDERLPDDMRGDAELLVQEADRTRRIVQNLLDFARQRPPERHPTSMGALLDSVLALQSYSLSAGRIELSVDVPPTLPLVDVDRSQLQQVLLNLTLNAIQAIRADRSAGHIWITARTVASRGDGARVRLSVSDDGPGIVEAARSRLFLPFYTTKAPGEGTGLGLSVSFGIVATHGGTLHFEPRPGGGATFVVELPVSSRVAPERRRLNAAGGARTSEAALGAPSAVEPAGIAPAAIAPVAVAAPSGSSSARVATAAPKVLVLDDEPSIRAFLMKSLRLAGLEPVAVAHGEDAVARCRAEPFAAVLVDHRMPGMSGTEVFLAVVAIRPELASRFVFMSGDVLNPDLRDFATSHQVALLAKPFDVDTVNRLVTEVVARSLDDGVATPAQRG